MKRTLTKIKPYHPEKIPPLGSKAAGVTPEGQQLFTLKRMRSRSVPSFEPKERRRLMEGLSEDSRDLVNDNADLLMLAEEENLVPVQRTRKNMITGEAMYPINQPEVYEETKLFFQESQGNGNIGLTDYVPPTDVELAAEERDRKLVEMREGLAAAFVDAGLTPAQAAKGLIDRVSGAAPQEPVQAPVEDVPEPLVDADLGPDLMSPPEPSPYPQELGGGWWKLSNDEKVQGKKDEVFAIQAAIDEGKRVATAEAKADSELVPEY